MKIDVRKQIIDLVKRTENEDLLIHIYNLLFNELDTPNGDLFDQLTPDQKEDTLNSLKERTSQYGIINHDDVMREIRVRYGWD